ncbi:MAG: hypothetical protein IAF38_18470, partial [Bacteroidia bacterium]|nr:hypothetical protein [Bacteroidia bacterium]
MKKILCSVFLFCALRFSAQTYYPFATDSATWTVVEYGYGTIPPQTGTWHYGMAGDTIFNGLLYSKLYVNQGSLGSVNPEPVFNLQTATYLGAIREDSTKKILFRKWSDTIEILRYDFSLNVGDTFCFNNEPCGIQCHQVAAVDSILINGAYRRQIHFSYGGQSETWIEGIGSIVGAFEFFWCFTGNIE